MLSLEKINSLQVPTWGWLKINNTSMKVPENIKSYNGNPNFNKNNFIKVNQGLEEYIVSGNSPVKDYINGHLNYSLEIEIPKNKVLEEPIVIDFLLDEENPILIDKVLILAREGSKATILINYKTNTENVFHGNSTEIKLEKDSSLKLIKSQMLGNKGENLDIIEGIVEENSSLEIVPLEIGSKNLVSESNIILNGENSFSSLSGIYIGGKNNLLDMNYRLEFRGKKSEGDILVNGILLEGSKKKLRSTLDFIRGSTESKGNESENIVALSDSIVNISAPLLLCGEDNVEGFHSTSTGGLDSEKLFYLMSRGLSEKEAKILIIEAMMTPIIDKVPEENIRKSILNSLRSEIYG